MGGLTRSGRMANKWMAGAVKPSHKGLFARKAAAAGYSTAEYAAKEAHSSNPTLRREAVLARTFAKYRPKKRGLQHRLASMHAHGAFRKSA
jgi:hypothetical protein